MELIMMYKAVIFAVTITTIVAEYQDLSITPCKAGARFNVDCNHCVCNRFGSGAACTRIACPAIVNKSVEYIDESLLPEDAPCEASKTFKYYCNQCICNPNGKGAACTRMACPPGLFHKDGSINLPTPPREKRELLELPEDGSCIAGRQYKSGCNTCQCFKNNLPLCTMKACIDMPMRQRRQAREVQHWGPLYTQGTPCQPNTLFYSECNQCRCLRDGSSAACTLMACPSVQ